MSRLKRALTGLGGLNSPQLLFQNLDLITKARVVVRVMFYVENIEHECIVLFKIGVLFSKCILFQKDNLISSISQINCWGHLNNKRSIKGGTKALQLKEKCKDLVSSITSKQHSDCDEEIQESII